MGCVVNSWHMDSSTIIKEQEKTEEHTTKTVKSPKSIAVNTLAIVGFLALIFIGIGLAIYSSQFVPTAVTKLSSNSHSTAPVGTVSTSYTTIPFSNTPATTTTIASNAPAPSYGAAPSYATSTTTYTNPSSYTSTPSSYGTNYSTRYPASAGAAHALYGLPDLATNIVATGYLTNGPGSAFVASPIVPVGAVAAIQFTIANDGTNSTGAWNFIAQIPTDNGYTYTSPTEGNMNPGDHTLYTLSFDQVPPGQNEPVRVIADPNNYLQESNEANNIGIATLTVVGS